MVFFFLREMGLISSKRRGYFIFRGLIVSDIPITTSKHFSESCQVSEPADDCCLVTDARPSSADTRTLLVSRTRTNFGDRDLSAAKPGVWNRLSTDLRQPDLSQGRFRQSLKTFLFEQLDESAVRTLFLTYHCALEIIYFLTFLFYIMLKRRGIFFPETVV